jgi:hypothetical protein
MWREKNILKLDLYKFLLKINIKNSFYNILKSFENIHSLLLFLLKINFIIVYIETKLCFYLFYLFSMEYFLCIACSQFACC